MQAVTFLVIHQKHKKSLEEITNDLCPVLSVQQLYRISTMYWDDRYNTETVSHEASPVLLPNPHKSPGLSNCLLRSTAGRRSQIQGHPVCCNLMGPRFCLKMTQQRETI